MAPGAQPSQHTAAAQTAGLTRERPPHYEQRDAIFASPKWQSVFVIRPHFGEGVTQRVRPSAAAGGYMRRILPEGRRAGGVKSRENAGAL